MPKACPIPPNLSNQNVALLGTDPSFEIGVVITSGLNDRLSTLVDAGGDKLIIDLSAIEEPTLPIMELLLSAIQAAAELSIRHVMVAPESLRAKWRIYEESQAWQFAATVEEAATLLK